MIINTTRFGNIEISEKDIYSLNGGILGFPEEKKYVILTTEKDSPFRWLQSIEREELAFIVTDPLVFFPDYKVEVTSNEMSSINLTDMDDGFVLVIVAVPPDPGEITANLLGPLVFNPKTMEAKQLVLSNQNYPIKAPLFNDSEMKE